MTISVMDMIAKLGQMLMVAGGASLALIFLIVMVNGSWPDFLEPVRSRFELGSNLLGIFWFPVLLGIFVGPGLAIQYLGEKINSKES